MTTRTATSMAISNATAGDARCTPTAASGIDESHAEHLAAVFKALGDPTRMRLLSLIAASDGAQACICDLTEPVGLSQGTVSHHMKILATAGFVTREQRGKWAYYAIAPGALEHSATALQSLNRPS